MTKTTTLKKPKEVTSGTPTDTSNPIWGPTLGLTNEAIKTFTLLASSIMFAAPAFATQANPNNIIALADMFYKFAVGGISVSTPSEEVANPPTANTTVFG